MCQAHREYFSLSAGCTTQLGVLALGGLGSCLQLTSLLPVLTVGSFLPDQAIANLSVSSPPAQWSTPLTLISNHFVALPLLPVLMTLLLPPRPLSTLVAPLILMTAEQMVLK